MTKKLFVGRLPFSFSDDQLRSLFIKTGTVVNAVMVPDSKNGRTRGFGFVDMSTEEEAQAAIQAVNGTPLEDKKIWVTLAREKGESTKPPRADEGARRPPRFDENRSNAPRRFGSKRSFADPRTGYSASPTDRPPSDRPPFRGKRPFPGSTGASSAPEGRRFGAKRPFGNGPSSSSGGPSSDRPPFRSGERKPFRSGSPKGKFSGPRPNNRGPRKSF